MHEDCHQSLPPMLYWGVTQACMSWHKPFVSGLGTLASTACFLSRITLRNSLWGRSASKWGIVDMLPRGMHNR
jgi:hypothetical protein